MSNKLQMKQSRQINDANTQNITPLAQRILHRNEQLRHMRVLSSSRFVSYQAFTFAGSLMLGAALLYYTRTDNLILEFTTYSFLFILLLTFSIFSIYGMKHDKEIDEKIMKNYDLLLEKR